MQDGKSRALWSHTSAVMALIANVNRDPKKKSDPFLASDFDPHARKAAASSASTMPKLSIKSLKGTLMGVVAKQGKA